MRGGGNYGCQLGKPLKRLVAAPLPIVVQFLNAGFVREGGIFVGRAGLRLRWIFPASAVHVVQVLGLGVIGFEVVVSDRPFGRNVAMMLHLAEVLQRMRSSAAP